jgi:hypothetical protein
VVWLRPSAHRSDTCFTEKAPGNVPGFLECGYCRISDFREEMMALLNRGRRPPCLPTSGKRPHRMPTPFEETKLALLCAQEGGKPLSDSELAELAALFLEIPLDGPNANVPPKEEGLVH